MKNLLVPHKALITGIKAETADVRTYTLSLDGAEFNPRPGQFAMLGYPGVGEAPVSLSSLPAEGLFQHTIREAGRVTGYLAKFQRGDELFIRGPYGTGWPLEGAKGGDLVLIAGGLGLAPLRPVLHEVMKEPGAFGSITLIYGARDPHSLIFSDEIDQWLRRFPVLLTVDEVPRDARWAHFTGLVTELIDRAEFRPGETTAFICGPEIMMRFAARRLLLEGVAPSRLHVSLERRMKCGVGQCGHCQHGSAFVCKDGPVFPYRDVRGLPDGLL